MNLIHVSDPTARALVLQLLKTGLLPSSGSTVTPSDITGSSYPAGTTAASISAAVANIGSARRTLHLSPGVWTVDAAVTIPANVHLEVDAGAVLTKSGAGTLAINGSFTAPLTQIFSGFAGGGVSFGGPVTVFPQWWGAVGGPGTADDTAPLQAALSAAQAGKGVLSIPTGIYKVTAPLSVGSSPVLVTGWAIQGTKITAGAAMSAIFQFADAAYTNFVDFRTLWLDGNHQANAGIASAKVAHSSFRRLYITGTKVAGLDLSAGWCDEIDDCEIAFNDGDAVILRDLNNVCNVRGSKMWSNAGVGVRALGAAVIGNQTSGLRVEGCTLESNAKGGVYLQRSVICARIVGNHFENNAATGLTFTTPAVTVKADVFINGSTDGAQIDNTYPCKSITVEGNIFDSPAVAAAVVTCAVHGLRAQNNSVITNQTLVGVYADEGRSNSTDIDVDGTNSAGGGSLGAFVPIDYVNPSTYGRPHFTTYRIAKTNPFNYFPQDIAAVQNVLTARAGGKVYKSGTLYQGAECWEIGGTDSFGFLLDLDKYTELRGKLLVLSAYTNAQTDSAVFLEIGGQRDIDSYQVFYPGVWRPQSITVRAPNSGTMPVGFRRGGGTVDEKVLVSKLSLVVAGADPNAHNPFEAPHRLASAAPTVGIWAVGDRVYNNAPAAGGVEGWVCTTAGAVAPAAWQPTTAYAQWTSWVSNAGNVYECVTQGTSAGAGGPTTTDADITDGAVHWRYIGPLGVFKTFGAIGA